MKKIFSLQSMLMYLLVFSFLITILNLVINICGVPAFYFLGAKRLPLLLHLFCFFEDKQLSGLLALGIIDLLIVLGGILWLKYKNSVFIPVLISYLLDTSLVIKAPIPNPYGFSQILTLLLELAIIVISLVLIIFRFQRAHRTVCKNTSEKQ